MKIQGNWAWCVTVKRGATRKNQNKDPRRWTGYLLKSRDDLPTKLEEALQIETPRFQLQTRKLQQQDHQHKGKETKQTDEGTNSHSYKTVKRYPNPEIRQISRHSRNEKHQIDINLKKCMLEDHKLVRWARTTNGFWRWGAFGSGRKAWLHDCWLKASKLIFPRPYVASKSLKKCGNWPDGFPTNSLTTTSLITYQFATVKWGKTISKEYRQG